MIDEGLEIPVYEARDGLEIPVYEGSDGFNLYCFDLQK